MPQSGDLEEVEGCSRSPLCEMSPWRVVTSANLISLMAVDVQGDEGVTSDDSPGV